MKRKKCFSIFITVALMTALFTGCGKQAGYGGEGHIKDACLNEAYSEQEMLNVKGEKVEQKLAESDKTVLADGKKKRIGAGALIFPLIYSIFDAICTSASGIS